MSTRRNRTYALDHLGRINALDEGLALSLRRSTFLEASDSREEQR
jgi:hypothetical protein